MLNEDLSALPQQNTQDSSETQRSPAASSSSTYDKSDSSSSSSISTPITSPTVSSSAASSSSTALTIPTAEDDPWKQRYEQDWGVFPDVDMSPQDKINQITAFGEHMSHLTARYGHIASLRILCQAGIDPNTPDCYNEPPLHMAAMHGHVACVTALLNAGANPNAVDDRRRTPLHLAAHNGHEACVIALLRSGADPNATESLLRQTPLNWSAARGHVGCATALLQKGVNPFGDNFLDETEATTLLASGVAVIDIPEIHRVLPIQLRTMIGLINDSQLVYTEVSLLGILLRSRTSQYPRIISTEKSREYSSIASFSPVGAPSGFMHFTLASCPPYIDLYGKNHLALALQGSNDSVAFLAAMPEQIRTVFINSLQHLASKKSASKRPAFLRFILGEDTLEQLEKLGRALNRTAPTQKFGRSTLFSHSAHNSPAASSSVDTSSQNKNDSCPTM